MSGLARWRGRLPRRSLFLTGLVATLVAGVGLGVEAAEVQTAGAGPGGCFNPVDFGAVANDGVSDRVPIQAAIDAATGAGGGTVCLDSGRWTVDRAPNGSYDHSAALSTHSAHLTISGTGPGTVIELTGDQGAAATSVISLDPGASDITIQGLAIDTSAATNTDEQTHAIEIGSGVCSSGNGTCSMPVADITVRDVRFRHPASGVAGVRKGDCVRLLGNTAATQVKRVTIIGSSFTSCARSGIGVQRNVSSLAVLGNHFGEHIGDTPFDSEATGGDWDDGLRLEGNSFADAPATFSATITTYRHATVTGNTFADRGVFLYRTQDVVVSDNTFDVTAPDGAGVIESENVASGDKIDNNTIRRHGAAGAGIRVTPHSGGIPQHVTISNNTISVDGDSSGIVVESPSDIGIRDNDITFTEAAPDGMGIYARATAVAMNGMMITGNTVAGDNPYFAAVQLHAGPFPISGVTVAMNSSRGALRSLVCSQSVAGNFTDPIVSFGNRWNIAPTCPVPTQPGQ
ncbi:MAG: right-handed parallel beta-helix repeat-containing protein [Mycobacteriales bacterium]